MQQHFHGSYAFIELKEINWTQFWVIYMEFNENTEITQNGKNTLFCTDHLV